MAALRRAWGIRIGLPASAWMLEIGTFLMRTESELVLKSRRVVPGRLLASGFEFLFPEWSAAAEDLVLLLGALLGRLRRLAHHVPGLPHARGGRRERLRRRGEVRLGEAVPKPVILMEPPAT